MEFKEIKIRDKFENDNSDVLIIDRESVSDIKVSDDEKNIKYSFVYGMEFLTKERKNNRFRKKIENL